MRSRLCHLLASNTPVFQPSNILFMLGWQTEAPLDEASLQFLEQSTFVSRHRMSCDKIFRMVMVWFITWAIPLNLLLVDPA